MDKPLLSICIPTYNRSQYLVNSIESIIKQEEFKSGKVEIVISDNASSDDTEKVGREYSSKYRNILYFRNEENIRDRNFPLVLSRANGVLRRLCNDTLFFLDGSLKYACDVVKEYKDEKPYILWLEQGKLPEVESLAFRDSIKNASYFITSIACFSIWDTECVGIADDIGGAELLLWQVRKSLELMSSKNSVVIVNKTLKNTQTVEKKNISYGLYQVFYENYFTLVRPYVESGLLTRDDVDYLEKDLLLNFFPYWCVCWKKQNPSLQYSESENLEKSIKDKYHDKPYWKKYVMKCRIIELKMKIKQGIRKLRGQ